MDARGSLDGTRKALELLEAPVASWVMLYTHDSVCIEIFHDDANRN